MMSEEKKDSAETQPDKNPETVTPQEPVRIKPAHGEDIILKPTDMAILVTLDTTNGVSIVNNIQNCPLRAYAKMLLHEALNLYLLTSQANTTVSVLEQHLIEASKGKKKDGLELPFHKKG